jgi:hypothetical protein
LTVELASTSLILIARTSYLLIKVQKYWPGHLGSTVLSAQSPHNHQYFGIIHSKIIMPPTAAATRAESSVPLPPHARALMPIDANRVAKPANAATAEKVSNQVEQKLETQTSSHGLFKRDIHPNYLDNIHMNIYSPSILVNIPLDITVM